MEGDVEVELGTVGGIDISLDFFILIFLFQKEATYVPVVAAEAKGGG